MKKISGCLFLLVCFMCVSCSLFKDQEEEEDKVMAFSKEQYEVGVGLSRDCNVENALECKFSIVNEKIAKVLSSSNSSCVIEGEKSGATVLKAVSGENECKCIISVNEVNDEKSLIGTKDEWFICTVLSEVEGITFFTMGVPKLYFDGEIVKIKRENGNDFSCHINDFISMEYSVYRG